MRILVLLPIVALAACNPAAAPGGTAVAAPEAVTQAQSTESALLREISGTWRLAQKGSIKNSFSTVAFEGDILVLGAGPDGTRDTLRMPLSEMSDGMYRIEWGTEGADFGAGRNNVNLLCGHGSVNWPWFVRLRVVGDMLTIDFFKSELDSEEPRPKPCLPLRWKR